MLDHIAPNLQYLVQPISSFNFDENNVLIHSDQDIQDTAASLKEHGQLEPIVVNARQNNRVLNGNSRLRGALSILGWTEIAAVVIDVSPEEADKIAADLNATGRNPAVVWNDDVLRARLKAAQERGLEIYGLSADKVAELRERLEDIEFPEYDESTADDVEFIECPSCGHSFPK